MTQANDHHQRRSNQLQIVAILVAIVVGAAAIYVAIRLSRDSTTVSTAGTPSASSVVAEATQEAPPDESSFVLDVGTCLSSNAEELPCDVAHLQEVFAAAPDCSQESLIGYLGGVLHRDVIRRDISVGEQSGTACVVELPPDLPVTRSLRGVMAEESAKDRSPWLRRCFDDRSEQDVDCSGYHTGEYVWEMQRSSPEPIDCSSHASEYIGTSIGPLFRTLEVEDLSTSELGMCRVSVKGSNSLEGSLRNLGSNGLPLAAR